MSVLSPNTRFLLYGGSFIVDFVVDGKVRFHRISDIYEVWELTQDYLSDKMRKGRLKILLDTLQQIQP